jgi:hypothetical protein
MGMHPIVYNLTWLISRFACLYLKESKCSKRQDSNFTNNFDTINIIYIIALLLEYTDMLDVWMRLQKNVFTTSFCLTLTTCHLQGIKQTLPYVKISNLLSSNLSPLLFSLFPTGQLFKSPYLLIGSTVKNLNTLLVHLHNTVPLSYWSFLSLYLSVTLSFSLTLYPCKLLYKSAQSIKYKILTPNKIKSIITVTSRRI